VPVAPAGADVQAVPEGEAVIGFSSIEILLRIVSTAASVPMDELIIS